MCPFLAFLSPNLNCRSHESLHLVCVWAWGSVSLNQLSEREYKCTFAHGHKWGVLESHAACRLLVVRLIQYRK